VRLASLTCSISGTKFILSFMQPVSGVRSFPATKNWEGESMGLAGTGKDVSIETNGNSNGMQKKVYVRPRVTQLNREEALARISARVPSGNADARDFQSIVTEQRKRTGFGQ
jgi:hypothetical protein